MTSDRRLRHSAGVSWREAVAGRLTTPVEALRCVRSGDTVAGKTLRERVGELIAVAHPDFRAELRTEARRLHHF